MAYSVTESELKKKIETYWLVNNRVHDAIGIKLNYTPGVRPTEMTVSNEDLISGICHWHHFNDTYLFFNRLGIIVKII